MITKLLKTFFATSLLLSFPIITVQSQDTTARHKRNIPPRPAVRNVIWFTPTRANQINGIALGTLPSSMWTNDSLHIKGLHVEVNPVALMLFPYVVFGSLLSPFVWNKPFKDGDAFNHFPDTIGTRPKKISGINISLLGSAEVEYYYGLSISLFVTTGATIKGISITGGQNSFYEFDGILIAGLMNNVNKGRGLQVALINSCRDCKGVQIGLINKMGKRVLPIINMRF